MTQDNRGRTLRACVWGVAAAALAACSQLVDFDRSRIPDAGSSGDGMDDGGGPGKEGGMLPTDSGLDGMMSMPDDSGMDPACNLSTHAGCKANELCCDQAGVATCLATSLTTQCEACGSACNGESADTCTKRVCECGSGDECDGATPFCVSGSCVECAGDANCTMAGEEQCVAGACEQCDPTGNAGCSGAMPICDAATKTCVPCDGTHACPSPLMCNAGRCTGCNENADCNGTETTPVCGAGGECEACDADSDCEPGCVGATCDQCLPDGSCAQCDPRSGQNNAGCLSTSGTPICDAADATCRACQVADCSGATPGCATTGANTGRCVQCTNDSHCTSAATPLCNTTNNTCVACNNAAIAAGDRDTRCNAKPGATTVVCATSGAHTGECTACDLTDHGGCATNQLCCNASGVNTCQATSAVTQCEACGDDCDSARANACSARSCLCGAGTACSGTGATAFCIAGACEECRNNNDCRETGDNANETFCDTVAHACVQCLASSDCTSADEPICVSGACVACTTDTQCDDKVNGTVCATSGANDGRCGACDPTDSAECTTSATPVCSPSSLTCVACTAIGSNAQNNTACEDKPSGGDFCVSSGGSSGQCAACDPADNDGCSSTTPICNSSNNQCRACQSDAECAAESAATPVCRSNGSCAAFVDCTTSGDADCTGVADTNHPECASVGANLRCRECDPATLGDTGDDQGCAVGEVCDEAAFTCQ